MADSSLERARLLLRPYRRQFEELAGRDLRGVLTVTPTAFWTSYPLTPQERAWLAAAPAQAIESILGLAEVYQRIYWKQTNNYKYYDNNNLWHVVIELACCDLLNFIPHHLRRPYHETISTPLVDNTDRPWDKPTLYLSRFYNSHHLLVDFETLAGPAMRALELVLGELPDGVTRNPLFKPVASLLDKLGGSRPEVAWGFAVATILDTLGPERTPLVDWEIVDDACIAWKELMQSPAHEFWEEWFRHRGFTFVDRLPGRPSDIAVVAEHRALICALTHDLYASSALAIDLVLEVLDSPVEPVPRLRFGPDEASVFLDGAAHTIANIQAYRAYKMIVDADGKLVSGLGKRFGKPDRLFRDHLPEALRQTYDSKAGNGGGYWLLEAFCRKSRDRP
jgi:hypothetical protein